MEKNGVDKETQSYLGFQEDGIKSEFPMTTKNFESIFGVILPQSA